MPPKAKTRPPDQLWLLPSEGRSGRHLVADVAVRTRTWRTYGYAVPDALRTLLRPGSLVCVPYGRTGRMVEGFCVAVASRKWLHTRKPVAEVLPVDALLSEPLIELALWISDYYACPPGQAFDAMVPSAVRKVRTRKVRYLRATGRSPEKPLTAKQKIVLDALGPDEHRRDKFIADCGVSAAIVRTLCKRGLVEAIVRTQPEEPSASSPDTQAPRAVAAPHAPEDEFVLTDAQRQTLAAITRAARDPTTFGIHVLFGVPGSGKTEVYVRAIREVIQTGRQAILLVPEIALATQVIQRLSRRFERVAVLHSRLPQRTRVASARAIAAGNVDVVIGTRTAVFAPCPRLGLIVVDEEQETSFKNLSSPYYHARDVAIKRTQIAQIPIVLGSATPALETWHNARTLPHYRLLRLPERVPGARLPQTRLIVRSARDGAQSADLLSPELVDRLRETLAAGRQAILLHNRRGYAAYLRCASCRLAIRCSRCDTHMVYHRRDDAVKCHRCGERRPAPQRCLDDTCGGSLERSGLAIQRLQEEVGRTFPDARVLRVDSDTMKKRGDYSEMLRRFEAREADILLGTQMVAKGLDFPSVQLVGVIDADAGLWLPDFRAAEHTFQLLVQVVGRAGRRDAGALALVQIGGVSSPAIDTAIRMDFEAFAEDELATRKELFLPPFSRMIRCVCADSRPNRARRESENLADRLRASAGRIHASIRVDEAEPCVVQTSRGRLRYQVLVRTPRGGSAQRLIREALDDKLLSPKVERFTLDVDPLDML